MSNFGYANQIKQNEKGTQWKNKESQSDKTKIMNIKKMKEKFKQKKNK
jgi:hypothetical protein